MATRTEELVAYVSHTDGKLLTVEKGGHLDSWMPYEVHHYDLLEGGGSLLKRIDLFPTREAAEAHFQLLTAEPLKPFDQDDQFQALTHEREQLVKKLNYVDSEIAKLRGG